MCDYVLLLTFGALFGKERVKPDDIARVRFGSVQAKTHGILVFIIIDSDIQLLSLSYKEQVELKTFLIQIGLIIPLTLDPLVRAKGGGRGCKPIKTMSWRVFLPKS